MPRACKPSAILNFGSIAGAFGRLAHWRHAVGDWRRVGEFAGADRGLGFLVNVGRGQYDTAMVFVAVLMLILMAVHPDGNRSTG